MGVNALRDGEKWGDGLAFPISLARGWISTVRKGLKAEGRMEGWP